MEVCMHSVWVPWTNCLWCCLVNPILFMFCHYALYRSALKYFILLRCRLTGALATACGDDAVRVFKEDESGDPDQPVFSLAAQVTKAHSQDVNCVAWSPKEAGLLASCSDNGEIAIWRFHEEDWMCVLLSCHHAVIHTTCTALFVNSRKFCLINLSFICSLTEIAFITLQLRELLTFYDIHRNKNHIKQLCGFSLLQKIFQTWHHIKNTETGPKDFITN